jgi:hypothetical protein
MPNHVTNRVTLFGKKSTIIILLAAIANKEENKVIDFENIKKMPEVLHSVRCPVKIVTPAQLKKELAEIKERLDKDPHSILGATHGITKKMQAEYLKKYGACDWYDWSAKNWGTKWNAYSQSTTVDVPEGDDESDIEVQFMFDTAWSTPYEVLNTLSEQYPTVEVKVEYADEDCGYNCGIYTLKNGDVIGQHQPEGGSKQAMDLYFNLHEGERDYYDLVDDNYVYKDGAF